MFNNNNLTSVNVAGTTVPLASHISILGAKLDSILLLTTTQTLYLSRAFITSAHFSISVELWTISFLKNFQPYLATTGNSSWWRLLNTGKYWYIARLPQ